MDQLGSRSAGEGVDDSSATVHSPHQGCRRPCGKRVTARNLLDCAKKDRLSQYRGSARQAGITPTDVRLGLAREKRSQGLTRGDGVWAVGLIVDFCSWIETKPVKNRGRQIGRAAGI